jgi:hypothetical protein
VHHDRGNRLGKERDRGKILAMAVVQVTAKSSLLLFGNCDDVFPQSLQACV